MPATAGIFVVGKLACLHLQPIVIFLVIIPREAFQLGIQDKKCSEDLIAGNKHTKDTDAVKNLKEFKKAILGIVTARNLIVHRGEFEDEDFSQLASLSLIERHGTRDSKEPIDWTATLTLEIKKLTLKIQRDKIALMEKNNTTIAKMILKLFESLESKRL